MAIASLRGFCMKREKLVLLVIDDNEANLLLIENALRKNGVTEHLRCLDSGEKAIAYLNGEGECGDRSRFPFPMWVMTELKMPGKDGFSVLSHIQQALNGSKATIFRRLRWLSQAGVVIRGGNTG